MSLLIVVPNRDMTKLQSLLSSALPDTNIEIWPNIKDTSAVEFVLAWQPPAKLWHNLPNLMAISSFGAGVDGLCKHEPLPNLPIARIVDPQLADDMARYVLGQVLNLKLRLNQYQQKQSQNLWQPKRAYKHNHIGILGLGQLGISSAHLLHRNGFKISAWSRTQKSLNNINCYSGNEGLVDMVQQVDYLICLLPLTKDTSGILNKKIFDLLPTHASIINVARGQHLDETDLIEALDNGDIATAVLDVFNTEPLPSDHPFWQHEKIIITPHASALTSIDTVVEQITLNYNNMKSAQPLINLIDQQQGY